jgi:hypothetical protein
MVKQEGFNGGKEKEKEKKDVRNRKEKYEMPKANATKPEEQMLKMESHMLLHSPLSSPLLSPLSFTTPFLTNPVCRKVRVPRERQRRLS